MNSLLFGIPADVSGYVLAGIIAIFVAVRISSRRSKLDAIPTIGSGGWLGSWWAGLKYVTNAMDILQEGYEKHKSAPFKVATPSRWLVVLHGHEHLRELHRAPVDKLSFAEVLRDVLQIEYTMGPEIHHNPYHVRVLRSQMTRNLEKLYPEIRDEIMVAFDEVLDLKGNDWKSVAALGIVQQVVCRTTNRAFVGLPLCRDPEWVDFNIQYTIDVFKGAFLIKLFPKWLKPVAARMLMNGNQSKQACRLLRPIIEERQKYLNEYGHEWADKPNDFLCWMMEEANGPELSVKSLTTRILAINIMSNHTISSSFTYALFYLAEHPQYVQPLREEVEGIIEMEGWSRTALAKMRKIDSFLTECQRLEGTNGLSLQRMALKDIVFSDGTFVPKGTLIATTVRSAHRNDELYENPLAFEPFRFSDMREEDGEGAKHQYVSTSVEYLPFGHGRQACPGRFFSASELKTLLAYVVVTYDIKLEDKATCPRARYFETMPLLDPGAKVAFRRRVD